MKCYLCGKEIEFNQSRTTHYNGNKVRTIHRRCQNYISEIKSCSGCTTIKEQVAKALDLIHNQDDYTGGMDVLADILGYTKSPKTTGTFSACQTVIDLNKKEQEAKK